MKFLIILSVAVIYASATPTFGGHGSGSGSASGSGGLGGIGQLLAIPLGIKKQLLVSHQTRINKHFDHIINTLNKFSSSFSAGGGGSATGTGAGETHVDGQGGGLNVGGNGGAGVQSTGFDSTFDTAGNNAHSFSSGSSQSTHGNFDANVGASGGSFDVGVGTGGFELSGHGAANFDSGSFGGSSAHSGSNVQTFHPQPAPQVQYKEVPITVHLYQVETPAVQAEPFAHISQPAPQVETQTFTGTEVAQPIDSYGLPVAPVQPSNTYGPPDHQPPPPIAPSNNYLPPCNDARHRHRF